MLGLLLMVFRKRDDILSLPDEDLMELYRDGEARAFEELLRRHERPVYNFIYRHVRDREKASDLLQETFLRVVKNAQRYRRKAKFTTWLYTIARNQSIDALRRAKHRRHASLDQPLGGDGEGRSLMEKVAGKSDGGFVKTDSDQVRGRIEEALAELSDEQREVFLMREFQQLKFKEIAEIVGVSENTIKSRMRYALENLRLSLADYAADLPGAHNPIPVGSRV